MTGRASQFKELEGRRVSVALSDGSRLDDCQLVSARSTKLWLFDHGVDTFVGLDRITDLWETTAPTRRVA